MSQSVRGCRRGSSGFGRVFVPVVEDFLDGVVVGDESDDLHLGAALGTGQGVDFIDAVDELGPALGEGAPGWCGVACIVGRIGGSRNRIQYETYAS